jgi:hypothetical protein
MAEILISSSLDLMLNKPMNTAAKPGTGAQKIKPEEILAGAVIYNLVMCAWVLR